MSEQGTTPAQNASALSGRFADASDLGRARSRWIVHLALLLTAAGALVTLDFLSIRNAIHADIGLVFVGLVVVHLVQRRRTIGRMMSQLARARSLVKRANRLTSWDLVLAFITLNVLVSGVLDWRRGEPIPLPLPPPFARWHLLSGIALVIFLVVHVWHRRKRLRRSMIQ